jgi:hypothetical protein
MMSGILSAMLLFVTLLIDEVFFAALPLPWRLLPLSFVFGLALMRRVSFELGSGFLMSAAVLTFIFGLAPFSLVLVSAMVTVATFFLGTRIFASRSLIAFSGLALSSSFLFLFLRFAIFSPVAGFFPWMFLFTVAMTTLLAFTALLLLEYGMKMFSTRFIRKSATYEVQTEQS